MHYGYFGLLLFQIIFFFVSCSSLFLSVTLKIKPMEDVSHKSSPDPMTGTPKDESGQETFETPRESIRIDQSLEPEILNNLEKLEAQEQINEGINEDEIVLQPDQPEDLNNSEEPQLHQINENIDPNKEVVLQLEHEDDTPAEEPHVLMSRSIQVFEDKSGFCIVAREGSKDSC